METTLTPAAAQALSILRDPSHFQWSTVPILVAVMYFYAVEVEAKNWSRVAAGLALFLTDVLWEIGNALLLHATGTSCLWIVSGGTSFLILPGWSIEIAMMFAFAGLMSTKLLPRDREQKILGVPNRWFFIVALSITGAVVESFLVQTPHFHWGYWWWNFPLVALIGYAPFEYVAFRVYDGTPRFQRAVVIGLATADALLVLVFGFALRWI